MQVIMPSDEQLRPIGTVNAYWLGTWGGCWQPDEGTAGAAFLLRVRDAVVEALDDDTRTVPVDVHAWARELGDGAEPGPQVERWQAFVELGGWSSWIGDELRDYVRGRVGEAIHAMEWGRSEVECIADSVVSDLPGVALRAIGRQLALVLLNIYGPAEDACGACGELVGPGGLLRFGDACGACGHRQGAGLERRTMYVSEG